MIITSQELSMAVTSDNIQISDNSMWVSGDNKQVTCFR